MANIERPMTPVTSSSRKPSLPPVSEIIRDTSELNIENDSAAPPSDAEAADTVAPSPPNSSPQAPSSTPPQGEALPFRASTSPLSTKRSPGEIALEKSPGGRTSPGNRDEDHSTSSAAGTSGCILPAESRTRRQTDQSSASREAEAGALSDIPRTRPRIRAPLSSLPAPFPPPARVGGGEGGTTSPVQSSEMNRSLVAAALDVGVSNVDELEVTVPSHQEHLTSDGQRYTTYEIVVCMGGRQWSVRKRYSQFDQFRHSLRKQHKEVGSFRFPNKSKFNTFSEHTKERRRAGFDEFLRLVAAIHPRPQEVDVFLAMDEHGAGVRGRSSSRQLAWTSRKISPVNTSAVPVLGQAWPESEQTEVGRRLPPGLGVDRPYKGGTFHRVPRFPPLAHQERDKKAAEAVAAAAASAAAASSRRGPSGIVRQVDLMLRKVLGPDLLSILCVVAVSAVSIVGVWKVGGKPGLVTLVVGVCVGLFIQHWDRGLDLWKFGPELLGMGSESGQAPSPRRQRMISSESSSEDERPRAESAAGSLGR